jgi:hypothetical protein
MKSATSMRGDRKQVVGVQRTGQGRQRKLMPTGQAPQFPRQMQAMPWQAHGRRSVVALLLKR